MRVYVSVQLLRWLPGDSERKERPETLLNPQPLRTAEDSSLLGFDAVSLGVVFPRHLERTRYLHIRGQDNDTTHLTKQHNIPEDAR